MIIRSHAGLNVIIVTNKLECYFFVTLGSEQHFVTCQLVDFYLIILIIYIVSRIYILYRNIVLSV